jgi:TonB family protein
VTSATGGVGTAGAKTSGVEVAGAGTGAASGTGGGGAIASYLTLVDWKIQQNWVPVGPGASPEAVAVIRFRVLRSGQVRDLELETSSGNTSLDASALRAVRQSLPLPPFPNLLTEPSLDLRYRFVMERG